MTGLQKFIKYAAIVFGIYLSIVIIVAFLGIVRGLVNVSQTEFRDMAGDIEKYHSEDITKEYNNIKRLEVDLEVAELIIRNGDSFKVEGTNIPDKMEIKQSGDALKISDEKLPSYFSDENIIITIYIPEEQQLDNIDLDMKDVSVDIEKLNATTVTLDMYNNYCKIDKLIGNNMKVNSEYTDIDIYDSEVKRLNLDSESGTQNINVKVVENAKIDLEYADTNIKFIGKQEDYQINSQKRFGTTYIDEKEITSNRETVGSGTVKINLDTNNADTNITFAQESNENYL